jgi:two-component system nitrogen regulation sensor histidine kinase GlnL|uniref:histidine kinase n=1 Tax=uncultured bacterium BAC13K9BAC TaxID=332979 RepID=Q4JMY4_9BACT|nr:predicted nitrogen regulation protein [uncultured bacterium BAC13K9BAC]
MELQNKISLEPKLLLDILENMSTAVVALNSDNTYFFINIAALNMLGISNRFPDFKTLKSSVGHKSLDTHIKNVCDNKQSKMIRDFKFKNFEGDEKIVDCNISQAVIDDAKVTLIELSETGRLHSISLEQNLIEQERAVREMIKGLSHEIKNPLGGILGAAQILEKSLDNKYIKFTDIIKKESGRLVNLLNDMALPVTSVDKDNINLHEATEHVIDLFKFDLKNKEVIFEKDYDPSIPNVLTNKEQLIQTLINLVRNSIQALKYKGNVLIKTRTEPSYTIGNKKYQLVAKIDVIDNGPGIPEEKLKEIFYPMVTTKNDGMGLGLTIAQSIVMQNSGLIECSSKHRETKFTIVLPIRSYEDE